LLARADVVIADALAPEELLDAAPPGADIIRFGRLEGRGRVHQRIVNRKMIDLARRGRTVVRLKGGDPFVFGRGGEEAEALARAGVRFEVVPGVTSALGAAACAGIPLTDRRLASSVLLATAHVGADKTASLDWRALSGVGTIILYMGVRRLEKAVRGMLAAGRHPDTPAALVRWATRADQQVVQASLRHIVARARGARVVPPALLVVGEVIGLRPRLDWFGRRPLAGRTIVVTRAREQAASFTSLLREGGARVFEAPAITLAPPASWALCDRAIRRLGDYDFVIFTSVNGVSRFFERLRTRRTDLRSLGKSEIVAIGPATAAAVEERGLSVAEMPEEFRAEGIVARLGNRASKGSRVLIPRAAAARDLLPRVLRARGARVDVVPVYRTVATRRGMPRLVAALREGSVDLLTFTSSSTVTHFMRKFRSAADRRRLRAVPAAVIGPITAATARRSGLRVAIMPRDYTIPALATAIVRRFGRGRPARGAARTRT
jgi:uroporphyrinogen III methyltransferase/synthase